MNKSFDFDLIGALASASDLSALHKALGDASESEDGKVDYKAFYRAMKSHIPVFAKMASLEEKNNNSSNGNSGRDGKNSSGKAAAWDSDEADAGAESVSEEHQKSRRRSERRVTLTAAPFSPLSSSQPPSPASSVTLNEVRTMTVLEIFNQIDSDGDGKVSWEDIYTLATDAASGKLRPLPSDCVAPFAVSRSVARTDNVLFGLPLEGITNSSASTNGGGGREVGPSDPLIVVSSRHHPLQLVDAETFEPFKVLLDKRTLRTAAANTFMMASKEVYLISCDYSPLTNIIYAFFSDLRLRCWLLGDHRGRRYTYAPFQCPFRVQQLRVSRVAAKQFLAGGEDSDSGAGKRRHHSTNAELQQAQQQRRTPLLYTIDRGGQLMAYYINPLPEDAILKAQHQFMPASQHGLSSTTSTSSASASPTSATVLSFIQPVAVYTVHDTDKGGAACFCFITPLEHRIVSCGFDHTLVLIDLIANKTSVIARDIPSVAKMMVYSEACQSVVTVCADNSIALWVTHRSSRPFSQLSDVSRPHAAPIVGLEAPRGTPLIITTDASGLIKVWDARTLQCVQSLVAGEGGWAGGEEGLGAVGAAATGGVGAGSSISASLSAAASTGGLAAPESGNNVRYEETRGLQSVNGTFWASDRSELVCCTSRGLIAHAYGKGTDREVADDASRTVRASYNRSNHCFISLSASSLRIWDAKDLYLAAVRRGTQQTLKDLMARWRREARLAEEEAEEEETMCDMRKQEGCSPSTGPFGPLTAPSSSAAPAAASSRTEIQRMKALNNKSSQRLLMPPSHASSSHADNKNLNTTNNNNVDDDDGATSTTPPFASSVTTAAFAIVASSTNATTASSDDPTTVAKTLPSTQLLPAATVANKRKPALPSFSSSASLVSSMAALDSQTPAEIKSYLARHTFGDLSAFAVDDSGRRVFIGYHNGDVEIQNFHGGTMLKRLSFHTGEVTRMHYAEQCRSLVSVSADGSLMVHYEGDDVDLRDQHASPTTCLYFSKRGEDPITALAVSAQLGIIAVGTNSGKIVMTNLRYPKQLICEYRYTLRMGAAPRALDGSSAFAVSDMCFLGGFPLLASIHVSGDIVIWACRPIPIPPNTTNTQSDDGTATLSSGMLHRFNYNATLYRSGAPHAVIEGSSSGPRKPNASHQRRRFKKEGDMGSKIFGNFGNHLSSPLMKEKEVGPPTGKEVGNGAVSSVDCAKDVGRKDDRSTLEALLASPIREVAAAADDDDGRSARAGARRPSEPVGRLRGAEAPIPTCCVFDAFSHNLILGDSQGYVAFVPLCPLLVGLEVQTCRYPDATDCFVTSSPSSPFAGVTSALSSPITATRSGSTNAGVQLPRLSFASSLNRSAGARASSSFAAEMSKDDGTAPNDHAAFILGASSSSTMPSAATITSAVSFRRRPQRPLPLLSKAHTRLVVTRCFAAHVGDHIHSPSTTIIDSNGGEEEGGRRRRKGGGGSGEHIGSEVLSIELAPNVIAAPSTSDGEPMCLQVDVGGGDEDDSGLTRRQRRRRRTHVAHMGGDGTLGGGGGGSYADGSSSILITCGDDGRVCLWGEGFSSTTNDGDGVAQPQTRRQTAWAGLNLIPSEHHNKNNASSSFSSPLARRCDSLTTDSPPRDSNTTSLSLEEKRKAVEFIGTLKMSTLPEWRRRGLANRELRRPSVVASAGGVGGRGFGIISSASEGEGGETRTIGASITLLSPAQKQKRRESQRGGGRLGKRAPSISHFSTLGDALFDEAKSSSDEAEHDGRKEETPSKGAATDSSQQRVDAFDASNKKREGTLTAAAGAQQGGSVDDAEAAENPFKNRRLSLSSPGEGGLRNTHSNNASSSSFTPQVCNHLPPLVVMAMKVMATNKNKSGMARRNKESSAMGARNFTNNEDDKQSASRAIDGEVGDGEEDKDDDDDPFLPNRRVESVRGVLFKEEAIGEGAGTLRKRSTVAFCDSLTDAAVNSGTGFAVFGARDAESTEALDFSNFPTISIPSEEEEEGVDDGDGDDDAESDIYDESDDSSPNKKKRRRSSVMKKRKCRHKLSSPRTIGGGPLIAPARQPSPSTTEAVVGEKTAVGSFPIQTHEGQQHQQQPMAIPSSAPFLRGKGRGGMGIGVGGGGCVPPQPPLPSTSTPFATLVGLSIVPTPPPSHETAAAAAHRKRCGMVSRNADHLSTLYTFSITEKEKEAERIRTLAASLGVENSLEAVETILHSPRANPVPEQLLESVTTRKLRARYDKKKAVSAVRREHAAMVSGNAFYSHMSALKKAPPPRDSPSSSSHSTPHRAKAKEGAGEGSTPRRSSTLTDAGEGGDSGLSSHCPQRGLFPAEEEPIRNADDDVDNSFTLNHSQQASASAAIVAPPPSSFLSPSGPTAEASSAMSGGGMGVEETLADASTEAETPSVKGVFTASGTALAMSALSSPRLHSAPIGASGRRGGGRGLMSSNPRRHTTHAGAITSAAPSSHFRTYYHEHTPDTSIETSVAQLITARPATANALASSANPLLPLASSSSSARNSGRPLLPLPRPPTAPRGGVGVGVGAATTETNTLSRVGGGGEEASETEEGNASSSQQQHISTANNPRVQQRSVSSARNRINTAGARRQGVHSANGAVYSPRSLLLDERGGFGSSRLVRGSPRAALIAEGQGSRSTSTIQRSSEEVLGQSAAVAAVYDFREVRVRSFEKELARCLRPSSSASAFAASPRRRAQ